MKAMKWVFFIVLAGLWVLYFYMKPSPPAVVQTNYKQVITAFCENLYTGNRHMLRPYITKHAEETLLAPGEGGSQAKTTVHRVDIFTGEMTKERVTAIVAVERTIVIQNKQIKTTHYMEIILKRENEWRVDSARVLADRAE